METHMIVLSLVLIGLAITLEPIPLTAFILILASEGGVRKGAAFIFGWLVSLAIVIAFTVLVTGNNPPKPSTAPSLALFCVIATSSILAMEIYAGFRPQPAQEFLARLRQWINAHTDQVIIIVSLVLGFWLVANSIYYLVT
jgi:hypothetical protein